MNKQFKALSLAMVVGLGLTGTAALAEQTIGVQTGATTAIATARVQVSVIVQKVVVLRVGNADATVPTVTFTVGPNPAVAGAPGNSLAYAGAIPPVFGTTVATTNPVTAAGALTVGAWTNAAAGASLTCALSALGGATSFATGATAAGVPGTDDMTVTSVAGATNLQHPTANLTGCTNASTAAIASLAVLGGTFTYGTAFTATNLAAGTYGNTVTYTATTL